MARTATNRMARHLLTANEDQLRLLALTLMDHVADELGMPRMSPGYKWPVDVVAATREFLTCVAMDDLQRVSERGSIFEQVGAASAHGGVTFDQLAAGIRLAARRTQGQVHRAVLAEGTSHDTEAVLELLARVVATGEAVVDAAQRGHQLASLGEDEGGVARRLASALINGSADAKGLATEAGWPQTALACAVLTDMPGAARIRQESPYEVAFFPRDADVFLFHPVDEGRLSTSLRPHLAEHARAVGPAVPMTELRSSLDLAHRAAALTDTGPAVYADDHLLELACSADPAVVAALRRKYFMALDALPADQRAVLVATLRAWLLQWGHRPGIAELLGVHPQTVSGRINRLKDLLADDLEDPTVRAELLVLLIAERTEVTGATRPRE